jgi:1-acyl-sn-glycerol-3-phosphate acyltransferase
VIACVFLELEPPRLAHGMAEMFLQRMPWLGTFLARVGQIPGIPDNAMRLLEDERMLLVCPEGARGTAKLYRERDTLVRFGTGFMRIATATRTPIVPFAFVGGGEAMPTIFNLRRLGKAIGVPYVPVTPYLLPVPLPTRVAIVFGEPMPPLVGPDAADAEIEAAVERVKRRIAELIREGRSLRDAGGGVRP